MSSGSEGSKKSRDITVSGHYGATISPELIRLAAERYPGYPLPLAIAKLLNDLWNLRTVRPVKGLMWGGVHEENIPDIVAKLVRSMYEGPRPIRSITIKIEAEDPDYTHFWVEILDVEEPDEEGELLPDGGRAEDDKAEERARELADRLDNALFKAFGVRADRRALEALGRYFASLEAAGIRIEIFDEPKELGDENRDRGELQPDGGFTAEELFRELERAIEAELAGARDRLAKLQERAIPGSIRSKMVSCGKSDCGKCPYGHGPYYYLRRPDGSEKYLGRAVPPEIGLGVEAYHRAKELKRLLGRAERLWNRAHEALAELLSIINAMRGDEYEE